MGSYFDCDPTLIRIAWVLAAFLSGGLAVLAYLVLIFVVPNEGLPAQSQQEPVRT
jgi:phage shock protein C